MLGLDPTFPLKFMIYFLIVVSVGGTTSITGPLLAALLLGIADVVGKYYIPKLGAFIVYTLMIVILLLAAAGPVRARGARAMSAAAAGAPLARAARWRGAARWRRWLAAAGRRGAAVSLLPRHALLLNEIAILALFAMSLDLILGYAGIVSLGHAAFFGFGAYAAALFAKHVMPDPLVGLVVAVGRGALLGAADAASLILRGTDLTRLMVTLGVALDPLELANKLDWLTGGADGLQGVVMGPLLGRFEFDLVRPHRLRLLAWSCCCVLFLLCAAPRALAVRHLAAGAARQPAARRRHRPVGARAAGRGLHARRGDRRRRRRAAGADHRLRLARRASTSTAAPTCC